jgi:hypothetical protein
MFIIALKAKDESKKDKANIELEVVISIGG